MSQVLWTILASVDRVWRDTMSSSEDMSWSCDGSPTVDQYPATLVLLSSVRQLNDGIPGAFLRTRWLSTKHYWGFTLNIGIHPATHWGRGEWLTWSDQENKNYEQFPPFSHHRYCFTCCLPSKTGYWSSCSYDSTKKTHKKTAWFLNWFNYHCISLQKPSFKSYIYT